jgi:branched-chain amino acid transport system ATP-binding protein
MSEAGKSEAGKSEADKSGALLEVSGLVAGYGVTDVLRGVDLRVAPGEIVAVLGSNGVGKTTLNKVLSGLIRPRAGNIRLSRPG